MSDNRKILNGSHTEVTVVVSAITLEGIIRHEQALETCEMSVWFCGLSVQDAITSEAGVMSCRLRARRTGVVVTVVVAVGTVVDWTSDPVVTVVVVNEVLRSQSTNWHELWAGACRRSGSYRYCGNHDSNA